MTRDRIAVFADGHLVRDDPGRIDILVRTLAMLATRAEAIYVLGDLFEVWLGLRRLDPGTQRVADAFREIRSQGIRTVYVEGNRDFRIGRGGTAGMFDVVEPRALTERYGSQVYHFSHGDLVNPADRPYRLWRAFAKGALAPRALGILTDRAAQSLASSLEHRLRPTNRRHKSYFPRQACEAYARRAIAAGSDVVVVGHFHRYEVIEVDAGNRHGRFVSLPFWHDEPAPLLFDGEGNMELITPQGAVAAVTAPS